MWELLILYIMAGCIIAKEQMKDESDKIEDIKKDYPSYIVFTAIVIAFIYVIITWPYELYKIFGEG